MTMAILLHGASLDRIIGMTGSPSVAPLHRPPYIVVDDDSPGDLVIDQDCGGFSNRISREDNLDHDTDITRSMCDIGNGGFGNGITLPGDTNDEHLLDDTVGDDVSWNLGGFGNRRIHEDVPTALIAAQQLATALHARAGSGGFGNG